MCDVGRDDGLLLHGLGDVRLYVILDHLFSLEVLEMTVTFGAIYIPITITLVLLGIMFRPYQESGMFDMTPLVRLFWGFPILLTWTIYFAILAYFR